MVVAGLFLCQHNSVQWDIWDKSFRQTNFYQYLTKQLYKRPVTLERNILMKKYNWKVKINFISLPESKKETRYKFWINSFKHIKKISPKTELKKIRSP